MTPPGMVALVTEYLALRRGLGFAMEGPHWLLRDFARYAQATGHHGPITIDLATRWVRSSRSADPSVAARRLSVVRQFARHRLAFDPATEVPPAGLLGRPARWRPPHVYCDTEIAELLRAAACLRPRGGLRPLTYVAFFSLLCACGLRLSEARRLARHDVDLRQGLLVVRQSKFRKSRLVPLHPTAVAALARYAARRDRFRGLPRSEAFFRTEHAASLTHGAVEKTFSALRARLGWTAAGRARRPRVHDLRHTFAVRRLLCWCQQGADVDRKVLALATYLGHAKVSGTYWYLSAVPELLAVTSERFEHFARREEERVS